MKQNRDTHKLSVVTRGAALLGACAACLPGHALEFEFNEFLLNVDASYGYAAQWRTESRDPTLSAAFVDNDGNNNFDPGLISSRGSMVLEVGGEYKDLSFFVRGDAAYDDVYARQDSDISDANYAAYNNGELLGGGVKQGDFPDATIDEHGKRVRLLDAFVTYSFDVGDQGGSFRLGRQVISWGEATFYPGINALQNPIDAAAALAPGTEAKEVFLPTSAIDMKWDFSSNISAEAYIKLDWQKSTIPGVGSYFSTSDLTGPGAERLPLGPLGMANRIQADKPDDSGQWGVAARYVTDNGANFELNYVKAHANIPSLEVNLTGLALLENPAITLDAVDTSASFIQEIYTEDITTWSGSFSTNLGEAQVYMDMSYSPDMPFVDTNPKVVGGPDGLRMTNSDVIRGHYWQVSTGFTDMYTAFPLLSEQIIVLGELLYQGNNLGESDLSSTGLKATDTAWGYQLRAIFKYFAVIPGMDVSVPVFFRHDVEGYGNAIGLNAMTEGKKSAGVGVDAFYVSNWQFGLKYAWFFGDEDPDNKTRDRDNVSLTMKYAF